MSTIHNPKLFAPNDYVVVDYIDNRPPLRTRTTDQSKFRDDTDFMSELEDILGVEHRNVAVPESDPVLAAYLKRRSALFPNGWNKCVHCGNTNVRFVVSVRHAPTGDLVCFGDICVGRLNFQNHDEFTSARLRKLASAHAASLRVWHKCQTFLLNHPEIVEAVKESTKPVHANNSFVKDVLRKLYLYGSLSPRQVETVIQSLQRDVQFAQRKNEQAAQAAANPPTAQAPVGHVEVTGTILSAKQKENTFGGGYITKLLIELDTRAKVWVTAPSGVETHRGDKITLKATFTRSDKDQFFSFGSRPTLVNHTPATTT